MVPLGVEGNEPAAKAYCKVTAHEKAAMVEAILQQKVGANARNLKQFSELQKAKRARRGRRSTGNEDYASQKGKNSQRSTSQVEESLC